MRRSAADVQRRDSHADRPPASWRDAAGCSGRSERSRRGDSSAAGECAGNGCSAIRGAGAQGRNGEGTSARASRVARGGRRCFDDRVRQRGEPSAGPRHCQAARDSSAIRHRRRSRANRPPGADRMLRAGDGRRRARRAARGCGRFARQTARGDRRTRHLWKDVRRDDSAARQRSWRRSEDVRHLVRHRGDGVLRLWLAARAAAVSARITFEPWEHAAAAPVEARRGFERSSS